MNAALRLYQLTTRYDTLLTEWGGSLMSLFLRLYIGWQFFNSGLVKISDWDATLALFREEYMTPVLPPALAAYLGAAGELTLPVLLFVGLLSRPAALGLFFVNVMAVISYQQIFKVECPAGLNDHIFWGVGLLALVAFGPGRFSLDSLLGKLSKQAR